MDFDVVPEKDPLFCIERIKMPYNNEDQNLNNYLFIILKVETLFFSKLSKIQFSRSL